MDVIDLKVTLNRVEPKVTRHLLVPLTLRLDRLHLTIQAVMGWTNSHLYMFEARGVTWSDPVDDEYSVYSEDLPAADTRIVDVLQDTGVKTLNYIYDFGDNWEHKLKFGRIRPGAFDTYYPVLLNAENCCPPEDVGGVPGYQLFLDVLSDPDHDERKEMLEWSGDPDFDSSACDIVQLDMNLRRLVKRWGHFSKDKTVFLE